jgi:hypothetical protein
MEISDGPNAEAQTRREGAPALPAGRLHHAAAYHALRRRGRSPAEAEHAIELTSWNAFIEAVLEEKDRRPEIWFLLAEGLPVEKIFPKLDAERRAVN